MREGTNNLLLLFFSWWYSYLPYRLSLAVKASVLTVVDLFSVKLLFTTLFAPWKRDIISYENLSLQERFSVFTLNVASRIIGFLVKIFVLAAFLLVFLLIILVAIICFATWLAFPLAIIALVVIGYKNIIGNR